MKIKLLLFLILAFFANTGITGLPPTTLQGWFESAKRTTFNFFVPNKQATKVTGGTLIETGNNDLLENSNFENTDVDHAWTVADASISAETSDVIDGKQALKLVYVGDPVNLYQDSTINVTGLSDGVQGIAYLRVKNGSDQTLYLCGRSAGTTASVSNCATIPNTNKWIHAKLPVILGGTSNGIALTSNGEFTTGTILVDDAFLGAQDVKQDVSTCADVNCETEFSARVVDGSATTTVSQENLDWIDGSCTNPTSGTYYCPFKSGVFSEAPSCVANRSLTATTWASNQTFGTVGEASASGIYVFATGTGAFDGNFYLKCSKSGTDYTNAKARANGYITTSTNSNTDWQSCGHTTSDFTGFGTVTNIETQCKRDGSDLLMRGKFTSGTSTAVEARVALKLNGTALTSADTSKIASIQKVGDGVRNVSTSGQNDYAVIVSPSQTYFKVGVKDNVTFAPLTPLNGDTFVTSGQAFSFSARIPIDGWENSNVIVGSFKDFDYVYVEAKGNAGQSMTVDTTPIPFIEIEDTHGLWDGDEFTPTVQGLYTFNVSALFASAAARSLVLSTTTKSYRITDVSTAASSSSFTGSITVKLDAGETTSIKSATTGGALSNSTVTHWLTITRIPGQF